MGSANDCRAYMPRAYMPRAYMLIFCIGPICPGPICPEPICSHHVSGLYAQGLYARSLYAHVSYVAYLPKFLSTSSENKTQYPFVLRGCVRSILYQRAWRLYIYIWPPFWLARYVACTRLVSCAPRTP